MTGRILRLVAVAVVAVAATVVPAASVAAAPVSTCTTNAGVLVVVDFRALGGNVQRGCAPDPGTGLAALDAAGFESTGTRRDGPGFVCRIDGRPSSDPCVNTPPASAYWSYWHANAGQQSWSYSSLGAASYRPKAGSVDAWVFGATDVGGTSGGPCFSPADARAGRATACAPARTTTPTRPATRNHQPAPATSAARATGSRTAPAATTAGSAATSAAATSAPRSAARATSPPSASPATSGAATTTAATAAPAIVDATPAAGARAKDGGGSALPLVLGLLLALVIGGAGAWTVRRRRTADGAEADGA